ncbi:hypothetical protein JIG36_05800 [Actinoplanes sp. LDG1-06]|uniref:Uncharacterized protein n=1 Tax=Paractinoplanes ovalisporus TaxID=2810368 RepID=A0ABS2A5F1_9ACTN|nr:hypothetical protein [Actinoplanes ovalisporus]MBM2615073.1 hypothetical protein [Actinoplanes ovalisporus]
MPKWNAGRTVTAVALGLVALGCARPGAGDGDAATLPSTVSQPSSVPPASVPTDGAGDQAPPPGDGAPHQAENNGWKQRHELTAEEQRAGDALAARIRPALTGLRASGDFAPASTRRVLLALGLATEDVQVNEMRTPPGTVFAVTFPEAGCVIGDVRPERVLVEVTGAAAEFGCLEPFTH